MGEEYMSHSQGTAEVKELSFEAAMARLETLVRELEDNKLPLDKALALFTEGVGLTRICNEHLAAAEQHISVLTGNEKDELTLKEIDAALLAAGGKDIDF